MLTGSAVVDLPSKRAFASDRYGGQFAFVEVINSMQKPSQFPAVVSLSTLMMGAGYVGIGMMGYWYAPHQLTDPTLIRNILARFSMPALARSCALQAWSLQ